MKRLLCTTAIGLAALAVLLATGPLSAAEVSLRTMSFNVRYAGTVDGLAGENGWFNFVDQSQARRLKAIQVVKDVAPDILGTQELLNFQLHDLSGETLPGGLVDYDYYGVGREDGAELGEYAAIFYLRDRFTRLDAGTFWLTNTPDVPGSIYPGAGTTRIASWVILEDHLSGQQLFVLNTHLDNVSSAANLYSAALIRDRLATLAGDLPVVLTGDMNSTETSSVLTTLRGSSDPNFPELFDAYREVHPVPSSNERTFHDFTGATAGSRIDFILHSSELTPTAAEIIRTSYDGKYPSDHYPVTAEFTLAVVPEPSSFALATGILLSLAAAGWFRRRET